MGKAARTKGADLYFIGIDPGSRGAAALVSLDRTSIELERFEGKTEEQVIAIIGVWHMLYPVFAAVEKIGARPTDGRRSTHVFGRNYGLIRGALRALNIPFYDPTPQVWQRAMAMGKRQADRKAASRDKAKALWPYLKGVTKETGDAVLIAEYCRLAYLNKKPLA